jgi:hypothetical protein
MSVTLSSQPSPPHFGGAFAGHLLPLIVLLTFIVTAHCAEVPAKISSKLKLGPACPALVSAANLNHIPIEGMDAWSGANTLRPGDSATVLVTFVQKKKHTQWLLYVEAATPDPAKATNKPATFVVGSAFGPPMKFKSRPYPVKLRMFGPFAAAGSARQPKWKETDAQFSLNEDFLGLGLDQAAALLYRWSKVTNFNKGLTSKALRAMNPTPEEQRALCAIFPALISYFNIVEHTEGLEDLLRKLIELPSLWSIIRHRGVEMTLTFGDGVLPSPAVPADWNLEPSAPAYYFPWLLRLNGEPALNITLVTTSPRPPLLICGGVVGVLAEKIGDEETYMTLRVISAKCKKEHKD